MIDSLRNSDLLVAPLFACCTDAELLASVPRQDLGNLTNKARREDLPEKLLPTPRIAFESVVGRARIEFFRHLQLRWCSSSEAQEI